MSYKIVYFTRTGDSKRIADKISNKLSCDVVEIKDNKNWNGIVGFIKGGFYASSNKDVEITTHGNINDSDEIILVTPLWAGKLAPATTKFIKNKSLSNIHIVVTSKGSNLKDRHPFKSINEIVESKSNEDMVIEKLVKQLI